MKGNRRGPVSKMAIKFCGGCNPTYDRREYWEKIKTAMEYPVNWVPSDDPEARDLLVICGCDMTCPEKNFPLCNYRRFILVRDDKTAPEEIAARIGEEKE